MITKNTLKVVLLNIVITVLIPNFSFSQTQPTGTGTSEDPYLISNVDEFKWIPTKINQYLANREVHFKQTSNIDFTGDNLTPIGTGSYKFEGVYNGDYYTLENFNIPYNNDHLGLFGSIKNGVVKNIKIKNATISSNITVNHYAGILAGTTEHSASNSRVDISNIVIETSTLSATVSTSNYGGLIGFANKSNIEYCSATVTVSIVESGGGTGYVGGLIGFLGGGDLRYSFSSGSVISNHDEVGGLVGRVANYGRASTVEESYSNADVIGMDDVGGLFGLTAESITVRNCFSTGNVTQFNASTDNIGSLFGMGYDGTYTNIYSTGKVSATTSLKGGFGGYQARAMSSGGGLYWNTETTDVSKALGYVYPGSSLNESSVSGQTTANMKLESTFSNFDFINIWDINSSINNGYPYLRKPLNIFVQNSEVSSFSISDNEISNNDAAQLSISLTKSSTTFLIEDIQVESSSANAGSLNNFTATNSKTYSVNYTPPSNEAGTVTFTIGSGTFEDDQSRSNTTTATLVITFDTISPTLSSITHDHDDLVVNGNDTVIITATFSENMTSSPTISIGGNENDIDREPMTATSSTVWTYTWNVPDNKNGDYSATVSGTDLFGNYYAGTDSITFTVDNTDPTLALVENDADDVLIDGETVLLTASVNETISGTPTLTITTSGGSNDYAMTSSGVSWTYSYSPPSSYSGVVTFTVEMMDVAGNVASTTISLSVDTIIPTIFNISSSMTDGTYTDYDGDNSLSDTVSITVSFTESVTVDTTNGSPRLLLNTTPASYVYYHEGSGTATLTFVSLVNEEVVASPLNVSALELNGGTIKDVASNTASLTIPSGSNLIDSKSIELDAKNPITSNYSLSDNNNLAPIPSLSVNDGDIATIGFQSDKELLISSLTVTFTGFTTTVTKTVSGSGPYNYELSFTVSNTFPEGDVEFDISATDQVTTTVVPIGNPTGVFNEEVFSDRIRIDRTAPTFTSNANLNSNENTTNGPRISASEAVAFSLIGGADQSLLSINQNTGVLTFSSAPDYEAPVDTGTDNTYEIIVQAIDEVGLTVTQTVTIQINDLNDTFGVQVLQTDVQTTESAETATIGFVLITEPTDNVTIGLSLSDETEGDLNVTLLTFTPDNWNVTQNITVDGVDDGLADGDVTYQLITANSISEDTNYNGLVINDVTLTNIDDEIDTDGDGFFDYQDAFVNDPLEWLDTDNDGIGNNTDLDDDGDGISDVYEIQLDTNPLDLNETPPDFNGNGIPDALEDSDGDGYNDDIDLFPLDPTQAIDFDGDGISDTDDPDDDNDGIPDDQDDFPLDNRYSKDTDNDGIPNLNDPDDDGDGYIDGEDVFPLDGTEFEDTDLDGIGNNADTDDDGDGIMDVAEDEFITIRQNYRVEIQGSNKSNLIPISNPAIERKNVGKWKIRKRISGGADRDKFTIKGGEPASPKGTAQQKTEDTEGYLIFVNPPDINNPTDHNRDNIYEVEVSYINTIGGDERVPDPENKGEIRVNTFELNVVELKSNPIPLGEAESFEISSDLDGDLIINSLDNDDDGDGILSLFEKGDVLLSEEDTLLDTDGDDYFDFQDPDDDNDGIFTQFEQSDPDGNGVPNDAIDSDNDGLANYLDNDDDGDGINSLEERADQDQDGDPSDALDFDGDTTPDYLDTDDDNDGLSTETEGLKDTDSDGTPDYHDTDDDNDGIPTLFELDTSGIPLDTDGDGSIDAIDSDDDGDGILTTNEDLNRNGDPRDDDTDSDGIPNYLESLLLDQDEDGVVDQFDSIDDDPYNDQDGDGYPNLDETIAGSDPLDSNSLPQAFQNPALNASIDIVSFFSPNSDGINDTWQVNEIDRYPNNQVWIFTRSGYEVFNTQNYRNDWSGTQNGNPLPEGSYYYRIDLDGNSTVDFEGWLYLTR